MSSADGSNRRFITDYAATLVDCVGNAHQDNYDVRRFGPEPSPSELPTASLTKRRSWLRRHRAEPNRPDTTGLVSKDEVKYLLNIGLEFAAPHLDQLQWLDQRLADDESRDLLRQLIAFRALGYHCVKLPTNRPELWADIQRLERMAEGSETIPANFLGWELPKLDLQSIGFPIQLFFLPYGAVILFLLQQYCCQTSAGPIEVRDGDVVVDAGGCWGDTAIYFSFKVGSRGKVFSFEFLPENLAIYRRNLELNPELAQRIELLPHPVWSSGGKELFVAGNGPGTTVTPTRKSADDAVVSTMSIDQLLDRPDVTRIDFIKMDIEGAELAALHGAEQTLKRFRPRLAITVYHQLPDFWEIPQYIDSLGLGYRFYLRHFTIHSEETVLFAESNQS